MILAVSCGQQSGAQQTGSQQLKAGETANAADLYADLPDKAFSIPMVDGKIVPHDWMSLPEEHDITTSYGYTGKNLMKSYQEQLKEAGFLDNGNVGRVESLWILERSEDGASNVSVATDIDAAAFNAWYMAEIAKIKR